MMSKMNRKAANAIIEISHELHSLNDFSELPQSLEKAISKYIHIDWISLYRSSSDSSHTQITTNPHLPFNWDELYQEIAPYDNFAAAIHKLNEGDVHIYHHTPDTVTEQNIYALEFSKKHTNTEQFMAILGSKRVDCKMIYGFYRSDKKEPFIDDDKALLSVLSPLIVSVSQTMQLYRNYDYTRTALEALINNDQVQPAVFDENLSVVDIALETMQMLGRAYQKKLTKIPKEIEDWIHKTIAPQGRLFRNTGPFSLKMDLPGGHLSCYAYIIKTKQQKLALLVKFRLHESIEDFSILRQKGLTPREITAIEYLPLGYSNKQIAVAMGIEEVSVKKHLKNAAYKLCSANKTETLYQALREKQILESISKITI